MSLEDRKILLDLENNPVIRRWNSSASGEYRRFLAPPGPLSAAPRPPATPGRIQCRLVGPKQNSWCRPAGPAMRTDPSQLQAAPGCPRCEAGGCVGTRWSPKCPTLESVAYMASEEGVDHQEAHFRPALLLRGIPADLDPASEGRAVLTAKACAGFWVNAYRQN